MAIFQRDPPPLTGTLNEAQIPGNHSPDNVKFRDISLTVCSTPAHHVKCYSYHAGTSVIVSGGVGMQQCMIRNQNKMHKLSKVKNG